MQRAPQTGDLTAVRLSDSRTVSGDFFFDCTGFRSLLLDKSLGVPWVDWHHWLPCDSALAVAGQQDGLPPSYTRSTAQTAGWQWKIPTQHRTGKGHIYCSEFMSEDEATSVLVEGLDGKIMGTPRLIRFAARDHVRRVHPLDAKGLRAGARPARLHYYANGRDEPFWRHCRSMAIPETLRRRRALFSEGGRFLRNEGELFPSASWVAVMLGQGVLPRAVDPLIAAVPIAEIETKLGLLRRSMNEFVDSLPAHGAFLRQYCESAAA